MTIEELVQKLTDAANEAECGGETEVQFFTVDGKQFYLNTAELNDDIPDEDEVFVIEITDDSGL